MGAEESYLQPGTYIDSDHPAVAEFARKAVQGATEVARAVSLYYAVRDGIRYNPFLDFTDDSAYRASSCLDTGEGFCVGKAALLAACARAEGIPARVGFADVKNHLSTPRLLEYIGSDLFIYHGYTELLLEGKWVKATPAFNLALCTKFRVKPLEFDGRDDSIFHPYDQDARRHMEYVRDRGSFADVPAARIQQAFRDFYPRLYGLGREAARESFG
ncbi:MAG TPA: transglutaminase family protein [Burkholderiales bacterium]|nr:transglutaminase family protein [Burkholderiales bacterium]